MKKLIKKINRLTSEIKNIKREISNIDISNYYVMHPENKERDKQEMLFELKQKLSLKDALLDSLSIRINIEKQKISITEKLTIKM
jgi:hypothetical protein